MALVIQCEYKPDMVRSNGQIMSGALTAIHITGALEVDLRMFVEAFPGVNFIEHDPRPLEVLSSPPVTRTTLTPRPPT